MNGDLLASITATRWISLSTLAVGRARFGPHGLSIGAFTSGHGARVTLDGDRLSIVKDGWRIEAFRRYQPLVYYAAFGRDDVFGCLRLAVESLFEFGAYDGDVAVLTDAAHLSWTDQLPEHLRGRIRTVPLAAADVLDWTLARYRVTEIAGLERYRPFLYLDVDIICDAPIDLLLRMLAVAPMLQAPAENDLMRPEDWYGASLLTADGVTVPPDRRGFSTGALGFPDLATVRWFFEQVPALAEAHAAKVNRRDMFSCYDQPFANYLAVKAGGCGTGLIGRFLDNRHYWHSREARRLGLAHFTGGTAAAGSKLPVMAAYVDGLRVRAEPQPVIQ